MSQVNHGAFSYSPDHAIAKSWFPLTGSLETAVQYYPRGTGEGFCRDTTGGSGVREGDPWL